MSVGTTRSEFHICAGKLIPWKLSQAVHNPIAYTGMGNAGAIIALKCIIARGWKSDAEWSSEIDPAAYSIVPHLIHRYSLQWGRSASPAGCIDCLRKWNHVQNIPATLKKLFMLNEKAETFSRFTAVSLVRHITAVLAMIAHLPQWHTTWLVLALNESCAAVAWKYLNDNHNIHGHGKNNTQPISSLPSKQSVVPSQIPWWEMHSEELQVKRWSGHLYRLKGQMIRSISGWWNFNLSSEIFDSMSGTSYVQLVADDRCMLADVSAVLIHCTRHIMPRRTWLQAIQLDQGAVFNGSTIRLRVLISTSSFPGRENCSGIVMDPSPNPFISCIRQPCWRIDRYSKHKAKRIHTNVNAILEDMVRDEKVMDEQHFFIGEDAD